MKLENKVAIITGGTKGIGYGIAEEYLKEGAKITICSRNAQEGVKAAKELESWERCCTCRPTFHPSRITRCWWMRQ